MSHLDDIRWRWRPERGPLRPGGGNGPPRPVYPHAMVEDAERDIAFLLAGLPRCATCRWAEAAWSWLGDADDDPRQPLKAQYPLACTKSGMSDGQPDDPSTLAFTMDGSEYRGELLVTPDFGCVMWEAKP